MSSRSRHAFAWIVTIAIGTASGVASLGPQNLTWFAAGIATLLFSAVWLGIPRAAVAAALAFGIGVSGTLKNAASLAPVTSGESARLILYAAVWILAAVAVAWIARRTRVAAFLLATVLILVLMAARIRVTRMLDSVQLSSRYLTMRDGVKIAIDLYLPRHLESRKHPAILQQTRYFRGITYRWPFSIWMQGKPPLTRRLVENGYAYVTVDARGSGASFGWRPQEWSADEVTDGAQVVDWIVAQPWSNGKAGATGISYDGTAAEMLLRNRHPAVLAIAPRFSLIDAYADIAYPGGMYHNWFIDTWGAFNALLDRNRLQDNFTGLRHHAIAGVRRADEDRSGRMLAAAIGDHAKNYDISAFVSSTPFRDDEGSPGITLMSMSPVARFDLERQSGSAILNYSGWYDGAYQNAAIERFNSVPNPGSRLVIGAWDHGGRQNISPFNRDAPYDHDGELLRFFDHHLKAHDTRAEEKPVRYFTMGEERWKSADRWPPPAQRMVLYLRDGHLLAAEPPSDASASETLKVDYSATSGKSSRWNSYFNVAGVRIGYPDRATQDRKLVVYDSHPLERDVEITGHAQMKLFVSSSAADGNFIAYLEDVDATGRVVYITEGELRALHRKLCDGPPPYEMFGPCHTFSREDAQPLRPNEVAELRFALLPTSYLIRKGHRIRIALAGADRDHVTPAPGDSPTVRFHRDATHASAVDLPVVAR